MAKSVTETVFAGHEPSHDPDERALFSRLAASMARHRRAVILVWLRGRVRRRAARAHADRRAVGRRAGRRKGSTAEQVRDELRRDFPALGAENPVVVYHQDTPIADDPAGLQAARRRAGRRARRCCRSPTRSTHAGRGRD